MARNHFIQPTAPAPVSTAVRLGAGNADSDNLSDVDEGKIVRLTAESTYNLATAGQAIEGFITSVEPATQNGWSIGGVASQKRAFVTADGLEATAGTGAIAVGDYVVAGTVTAKGTALTAFPKVCKATNQPGATVTSVDNTVGEINIALAKLVDQQRVATHGWRVVSLGTAGTGAVGTTIVIERVSSPN